jgi:hypothetical protein
MSTSGETPCPNSGGSRRREKRPDPYTVYDLQPAVIVGAVPEADYYRALYPGYVRPRNGFHKWKYETIARHIARAYWDARERARIEWEDNAGELLDLIAHPPVVL